jgi:hypothetical protein
MKKRIVGFDISAKRIAWAICDSVAFYGSGVTKRQKNAFGGFLKEAYGEYMALRLGQSIDAHCIEINLHPKVTHKGHVSPKMIRAYMRSRWIEGAFLHMVCSQEPSEITRKKGGFYEVERGYHMYSLAASWTQKAKESRRYRMLSVYASSNLAGITQDEVDALAIAHDCSIALAMAERGVS